MIGRLCVLAFLEELTGIRYPLYEFGWLIGGQALGSAPLYVNLLVEFR